MKKEQLVKNYEEIVEKFYREAQHIIYCRASPQAKSKMLHSAHYWAKYFLSINNRLLEKELQK